MREKKEKETLQRYAGWQNREELRMKHDDVRNRADEKQNKQNC